MSCSSILQALQHLWNHLIKKDPAMSSDVSHTTLYFGYGSNLWLHQMEQRCPTSKYLGIARLNNFRWIINERGYANVVEVEKDNSNHEKHSYDDEVWGLVYSLEQNDEDRLDRNEGVPISYTKEILETDFWPTQKEGPPNTKQKPKTINSLVYINRKQVSIDKPKTEYIYRMNMGIKDALTQGMPAEYIEQVMRKFIPEDEDDDEDEDMKKLALKQAEDFEDGL